MTRDLYFSVIHIANRFAGFPCNVFSASDLVLRYIKHWTKNLKY